MTYQRGKLVSFTAEVEYPDGTRKIREISGSEIEGLSTIYLTDDSIPEEAADIWAKSNDWKSNPTMILGFGDKDYRGHCSVIQNCPSSPDKKEAA